MGPEGPVSLFGLFMTPMCLPGTGRAGFTQFSTLYGTDMGFWRKTRFAVAPGYRGWW